MLNGNRTNQAVGNVIHCRCCYINLSVMSFDLTVFC